MCVCVCLQVGVRVDNCLSVLGLCRMLQSVAQVDGQLPYVNEGVLVGDLQRTEGARFWSTWTHQFTIEWEAPVGTTILKASKACRSMPQMSTTQEDINTMCSNILRLRATDSYL